MPRSDSQGGGCSSGFASLLAANSAEQMSTSAVLSTVPVRETEARKRTLDSVDRLTGAQELAGALLELRGGGGRSGAKRRRFADRAMEVLQTSSLAAE